MSKSASKRKATKTGRQYAALPVRLSDEGAPEVLLLTSRDTRRWVIPKGWPMPRRSPAQAAAQEAFEEAGLEGSIEGDLPIGQYRYAKGMPNGTERQVKVLVFLLRVERQLADWPEQDQRTTCWYSLAEAATLVAEPALAQIMLDFDALPPG